MHPIDRARKESIDDALKCKRLYVYEGSFWRAVGGTAKNPSLIKICSVNEVHARAKVDKNGRVIAFLWADSE